MYRDCAVKAGLGPAQDSKTNSRETSSVSLKAPTTQLGLLVFWFQVCLLFSECFRVRQEYKQK